MLPLMFMFEGMALSLSPRGEIMAEFRSLFEALVLLSFIVVTGITLAIIFR